MCLTKTPTFPSNNALCNNLQIFPHSPWDIVKSYIHSHVHSHSPFHTLKITYEQNP